jgi:hypothetical protein
VVYAFAMTEVARSQAADCAALEQVLAHLPEDPAGAARAASHAGPGISRAARAFALGPLFAHYLPAQFPATQGQRATARFEASRLAQATVEITRALEAVGVEALTLKGAALAAALYPEAHLRPSIDVDLLVRPRDLARACRAVEALGYRVWKGVPDLPGLFSHHHQYSAPGKVALELHHSPSEWFVAAFDVEQVFARARRVELDGRVVRIPGPVDELVHLCVHAASHRFQGVKWLFDLKLLLQQRSVSWPDVVALARRAQVAAAVGMTLAEARARVHAPVPDSALRALGPGRWRAAGIRAIATLKPSVAEYLFDLGLVDRPSSTWLMRAAIPPARRAARALGAEDALDRWLRRLLPPS